MLAALEEFLPPGMVPDEGDDELCSQTMMCCSTSVGSDRGEDSSPNPTPRHESLLTFVNVLACAEADAAKREAQWVASTASASSTERPTDTFTIFDWDDTLCPTTSGDVADEGELQAHAQAAEHVLRTASRLGRVEIVTMAGRGWVEQSAKKYMPGMTAVLEELQVPVTLSRVDVPRRTMLEACSDDRDPSHYLKRQSMRRVVADFTRCAPEAKSVISVGDAEAERLALQDVMLRQPCGSLLGKVVKLKSEPSVAELSSQLSEVGGGSFQYSTPLFYCFKSVYAVFYSFTALNLAQASRIS